MSSLIFLNKILKNFFSNQRLILLAFLIKNSKCINLYTANVLKSYFYLMIFREHKTLWLIKKFLNTYLCPYSKYKSNKVFFQF